MTKHDKRVPQHLVWDRRVRDRNLNDGVIDGTKLDAYLQGLPDLADSAETIDIDQPALGGSSSDESFEDDEEDN